MLFPPFSVHKISFAEFYLCYVANYHFKAMRNILQIAALILVWTTIFKKSSLICLPLVLASLIARIMNAEQVIGAPKVRNNYCQFSNISICSIALLLDFFILFSWSVSLELLLFLALRGDSHKFSVTFRYLHYDR